MATSPPKPATWSYSEAYVPEDEVIQAARARALEVGVAPIGSGGGAALRFLASVLDARAVVEIGTGTGVSGTWLLRPGGVVAFDNALWHDRVADPAQRDEETIAIRELGREIADHESLVPLLLPVGDGLLLAKKEWAPEQV